MEKVDKTYVTNELSPNFSHLLQIAFAHVGVSIGIVSVNSFLNSELRFIGWKPSLISIYLGTAILFELSRIFAGKYFDKTYSVQKPLILSLVLIISGILLLPIVIEPVGNIWIIFVLGLFFIGSAIASTLVDSVLTVMSNPNNRTKVAGVLQTLRLSGFALGGIIGAIIYSRLSFTFFCIVMGIICGLTVLVSLNRIISIEKEGALKPNKDDIGTNNTIKELFSIIKQPRPLMMALFLVLYPLGLFMQDLILETFTIDNFNYSREGVGRVVIIWSALTLIFVPVGVKLEGTAMSKRSLGLLGALIGTNGLLLISMSTLEVNGRIILFFIGLVLFGIGNGLISAPVIGLMLDISAEQKHYTAMLLGFYGVLLTIGRFNAAWVAGLILFFTDETYLFVFFVEALFLASTCIPIYALTKEETSSIAEYNNFKLMTDIN